MLGNKNNKKGSIQLWLVKVFEPVICLRVKRGKRRERSDFVKDTRSSRTERMNEPNRYKYTGKIKDRPLLPFHYTRREITLFSSFFFLQLVLVQLASKEEHLSKNIPIWTRVRNDLQERRKTKQGKERKREIDTNSSLSRVFFLFYDFSLFATDIFHPHCFNDNCSMEKELR